MEAPTGSLIAFATAPKSVSPDGNGENSLYTQALAKAMKEPGLAVGAALWARRELSLTDADSSLSALRPRNMLYAF
jgi:uncharacterized caspase-like protein